MKAVAGTGSVVVVGMGFFLSFIIAHVNTLFLKCPPATPQHAPRLKNLGHT